MYKIYAQIGFSTNRQTFNNNFVSAEKSPIFTSHKSYKITLFIKRVVKLNLNILPPKTKTHLTVGFYI
jgi:hypothetical protein